MKNKNSLVLLLGFTAVLLWWSGSHDISYGRSEASKENTYDPGKLKPTDSLLKVKVGDRAPHFALPSLSGGTVSLGQYLGKKNVVLSFFPAAWTPVCSDQWPG